MLDLGFISEEASSCLKSHCFPSKVGGKPSWLSLSPLPSSEIMLCQKCRKPLIFLIQVYSPMERSMGDAFHRTIFVFVCKNASCLPISKDNFLVLRSQLPRNNDFFKPEPPEETNTYPEGIFPSASAYHNLCEVCGCLGSKKCSRCPKIYYCSQVHQISHWRAGHKINCGKEKLCNEHFCFSK